MEIGFKKDIWGSDKENKEDDGYNEEGLKDRP